ncbi:hypothetical protein GCM10017673_05550 [Streptosporangium violaceochromogenes]|nr:hypothetical protein GCM10017673_05550 [Streptosporangium violaceochromogenes]
MVGSYRATEVPARTGAPPAASPAAARQAAGTIASRRLLAPPPLLDNAYPPCPGAPGADVPGAPYARAERDVRREGKPAVKTRDDVVKL